MKQSTSTIRATALLFAALIIMFSYSECTSGEKPKINAPVQSAVISAPAIQLKANMRKLWEEHSAWTRNVILCMVDDLPGTEQAVKRLMQNQLDIGDAFKSYYGEESGKKITELLYAHVSNTTEVIKALKSANTATFDVANKKWYANADEIAALMSQINPNWTLADMKMMMNDHLKMILDEITQRINENYEADVLAFDKAHSGVLKISDIISEGIVKQYPEKF